MKRLSALVLIVLLISGCRLNNSTLERALALREELLKSSGCVFDAVITADYGDKIHNFKMSCSGDASGDLSFCVIDPETISGIKGSIADSGGKLTFDDVVLAFEPLAEGQISPISAPWIFLRSLRSGYLKACGEDGQGLMISIDDSYHEDALHLYIWTDQNDIPIRAEILWQSRRVITMDVRNFQFL